MLQYNVCIYEDYGGKPREDIRKYRNFAYLTKTIGALGES